MINVANTHQKNESGEGLYVLTIDGTAYKDMTLQEILDVLRNMEEEK